MLRQDRHQAEDQRQFAVVGAGEVKAHRERVERLGLGDLGVILPVVGAALVAQQRPGEQHVLGGDRLAVGEAGAGIEAEGDIAPRVVGLDALGEQAVKREGLVIAARHQALDHEAADLLHGKTPDDQRIEAVEGAEHAPDQPAALGRIGIGIGHMGEIGRQRRRAMHRDGVALGRAQRAGSDRHAAAKRGQRQSQATTREAASKAWHRQARI